jgi:hypothetical protein
MYWYISIKPPIVQMQFYSGVIQPAKFLLPGIHTETVSTILFTLLLNNRENNLISKPGFMKYKVGTKEKPMVLKTPALSSVYTMHTDIKDGKEVLVCTVGKTVLLYDYRCLTDLHAMLKKHGDWVELGSADEQKPAKEGTVEAWGRSEKNPVGGWYGLKKGLRGRFGMYIPPLMEMLGLVELTHDAKGNKMRAK